MSSEPLTALVMSARRNGLELTPAQAASLGHYVELLLDWNTRINLISRKDVGNVWEAHILHSLSILFGRSFPAGMHVLDLGSGGGLPGIPFAIARPDSTVVLLDSIGKKIHAVEEMVVSLKLKNATPVCARAEALMDREEFSHSFDMVIARGVASLADVARWSTPLLRPRASRERSINPQEDKGKQMVPPCIVCLKGGDLEKEVQEARMKARLARIHLTDLPFRDGVPELLQGKKLVLVYP